MQYQRMVFRPGECPALVERFAAMAPATLVDYPELQREGLMAEWEGYALSACEEVIGAAFVIPAVGLAERLESDRLYIPGSWLDAVVVAPDWRGRGAGRALVSLVLAEHPVLACRSGADVVGFWQALSPQMQALAEPLLFGSAALCQVLGAPRAGG